MTAVLVVCAVVGAVAAVAAGRSRRARIFVAPVPALGFTFLAINAVVAEGDWLMAVVFWLLAVFWAYAWWTAVQPMLAERGNR